MTTTQINTTKHLILVTGPARSGKSEWAETLAMGWGKPIIYVATAQIDPNDPEWLARIEQHQRRRPSDWTTLQVPVDLPTTLRGAIASECLLIDSLGTWVANLLEQDNQLWENTLEDFLDSLQQSASDIILVAEETGWGVVPAYKSGRTFRDRLGTLVRRVGSMSNPTYLVTGGYVLNLNVLGSRLIVDS